MEDSDQHFFEYYIARNIKGVFLAKIASTCTALAQISCFFPLVLLYNYY